jgi:hypothetical protein
MSHIELEDQPVLSGNRYTQNDNAASVSHGGRTYAESEAASNQQMKDLLELSAASPTLDLDDLDWIMRHPNATQEEIDSYAQRSVDGQYSVAEGQ